MAGWERLILKKSKTLIMVLRNSFRCFAGRATPGIISVYHDVLVCGRRFRTFNVVDDFNREALAIEIDLNIPAQRVVRVLGRIVANRGCPLMMRMDNGPELISLALAHWAEERGDAGIYQAG